MKISFILTVVSVILSTCVTLPASLPPEEVPVEEVPVAESELIPLLLTVNQTREESARIIAELMETKNNPESAGSYGEISELLLARLEGNHLWVESTGRELETRPFENQEVSNQYRQIVNYNQQLIIFEYTVIDLLSQVENAQDFRVFIDNIFEMDNSWPFLLTDDENFRILLGDLASKHIFEFDNIPYDKIMRDRLGELRAPEAAVDPEQLGRVTYEFDIPEQFSQIVVSVGWTGVPVDVFQFALQHPDGRTLQFKLAPLNEKQYIYHIPINHLPAGGSVVTIPNEEYPALEKITGQEKDATVGYEQEVVVIKLFPDDPILAPMDGKWSLTVTAPAGLEIIFGAAPIP